MPNNTEYLTLSSDQAKAILERGQFEDFKGVVEGTHLDFKRDPYPIFSDNSATQEKAKRDLVEDVVRFANVEGGIIVLGIETEQLEDQRNEVGKVIHPFSEARLDSGQYRDVILARVKPQPQGVTIRWFPATERNGGLGAVIVPPQEPQLRKTFFATRTLVDETTGKTLGAYVGYLERIGADSISMSAEELYQTFLAGRRFTELSDRIDSLTEMVKRLVDERAALSQASQSTRPRLAGPDLSSAFVRRDDAIATAGLEERPTISLIAVPGEAVDVPELFAGSRSELVRLLENPPELRRSGFDITVGERPVVVASGIRRAVSAGSKALQLSRDGVLIFVADAQNLLCWGTGTTEEPLHLNVLALAEATYLFAELVRRVQPYLVPTLDTWRYVIELKRMSLNQKIATLPAGPLRSWRGQRTLPGTDLQFELLLSAITDPRIVAYKLRLEIYIACGLDEDAIPYVIDVNGTNGTDPEQITAAGK